MTVSFDLSERHVAVFGAAGALGAAIAAGFRHAHAMVSAYDVEPGRGCLACDARDPDEVSDVLTAASDTAPLTDIVHAAGVLTAVAPLAFTELKDAQRMLEVNLFSCFVVGQAAARHLTAGGSVTFVSSHAALHGAADWSVYSATKAGVNRLAESLAKELGPAGIRANAICPGSVDSPMMDAVIAERAAATGLSADTVRQRYTSMVPLRRFATTEDITQVCLFLASPAAGYISGTVINVDGGESPG